MKNCNIIKLFLLLLLLCSLKLYSNYSLQFDGTNSYVSFSTNAPAYNNSSITIEAWIKTTSTSGENIILSWEHNSLTHNAQFRTSNGKLTFGIDNGSSWNAVSSNSSVNTGNWTHVAVVKDGSTVLLYINGVLDNTGSIGTFPTVDQMFMGRFKLKSPGTYFIFDGLIAQVRIWNAVRTASQISLNKDNNLTGNENNLLAYYKMSDGSGTVLTDDSINSNTGTLVGNTIWNPDIAFAGEPEPTFSDHFTTDKSAEYIALNIWNAPGTGGWNIVDNTLRMNHVTGTRVFLNQNYQLNQIGHYTEVDFRILQDGDISAGLYLNDTLDNVDGVEVRFSRWHGSSSHLEISGVSSVSLPGNMPTDWNKMRIELISINGNSATYRVTLSGELSADETFTAPYPAYVGLHTYNSDGSNIVQDNFVIFGHDIPYEKLEDFSSPTSLTDNFVEGTDGSGASFVWEATAGLSGGGGISVPIPSNQIWTTKEAYSIAADGVYVLSAYFKIAANAGHGALGFSTLDVNSASGSSGMPGSGGFLGISFHGGGGNWLNNSIGSALNWDDGDMTFSPATWYFMELTIEAKGGNNFDLTFRILNSDDAGNLGSQHTQHTTTLSNSTIAGSNNIYVFFSGDGSRISAIDNFKIQLSGDAQINFSVTYDANGADGGNVPVDSSSPYVPDSIVHVLENTGNLTKTGYTFSGWNTQPDGGGSPYQPNDTFTMGEENVTLYAVWTLNYFEEGDGSEAEPFLISTIDDLQLLSEDTTVWGLHFRQAANIDASVTSTWDGGAGFSPIGNEITHFTGVYDGDSYTISNLAINRPGDRKVGFFGVAESATIKNLNLTNIDVIASHEVGALLGHNVNTGDKTLINNCHVSGSVNSARTGANAADAGGLLGYIYNIFVSNSSANVDVTAIGRNVGGFVGDGTSNSAFDNCFATGNVTSTGTLEQIGGFAGLYRGSGIKNSYAIGNVTGGGPDDAGTGGFIGDLRDPGTVENSYSTGKVSGSSSDVGGFIGKNNNLAGVTNSFWNIETSGQTTSVGGTGKTTAEMQIQSTFTDAGWDFSDTWTIAQNLSYPYFIWQTTNIPYVSALTIDSAVNIPEAGTVTLSDDTQFKDSLITITAISNPLYLFDSWTVSPVSGTFENANDSVTTFTVGDTNVTLTANYVPIFTGDGSEIDPFIVSNILHLQALSENSILWDKHFRQTVNIDASVTSTWNDGAGFSPIGNETIHFTGVYDGDSHTISNLFINRPGEDYIGLFGYAENSIIKNVVIDSADITGTNFIAAFAGYVENSIISNIHCNASVTTTGSSSASGIVIGRIQNSDISNIYSTGNIIGWQRVGGLIGRVQNSTVRNSNTSATVSLVDMDDSRFGGGAFGVVSTDFPYVENVFATGNVIGNLNNNEGNGATGGLIGFAGAAATIKNSYSLGDVFGPEGGNTSRGIGGLIGNIASVDVRVENCYSIGAVTGTEGEYGGLIGSNSDGTGNNVINSFWNTETSNYTTSAGGTGKTTSEMHHQTTYTETGWDFSTPWAISSDTNSGYPFLGTIIYSGPVFYVDPNTGNDNNYGNDSFPFKTISGAMNNVSENDTILVEAGIYNEQVIFTQNGVSLLGIDSSTTIIDAGDSITALVIGIYAENKENINIKNFQIRNVYHGIQFDTVTNSIVENVSVNNCGENGIYINSGSDSNTFINNQVSKNTNGFYFYRASFNTLNNNRSFNNDNGIFLYKSNDNYFIDNDIESNNNYSLHILY